MYQIDNSTAVASIPASTTAGTSGFFTDGNPATGVPATIMPAEFMNMLMMEVLNVLSAAGVTPSKSSFTQLTTAIRTVNKQSTVLVDTGTAGVYKAVNVPALTALPASGFVQTVRIVNANPGAATYAPDGLAAKPIYGLGLQPLQGGELPPGIAVFMYLVQAGVNGGNGAWILLDSLGGALPVAPATQSQHAVQFGQVRARLTANLTVYVATTGADIAGNGLTVGTPFLTGTYAYNFIQRNYDLNGFSVTIQLANGSYGQIICTGQCVGAQGAAVTINGSATASNVTIAATANGQGLLSAGGGALIIASGFTVSGGAFTGCTGLITSATSSILFSNITFGVMPSGSHMQSSGQIQASGTYAVTGSAAQHFAATNGSITTSAAVTITGTPVFSLAFAYALQCGTIVAPSSSGASFTGATTGAKYSATLNAVINTSGSGASFFPGSVAGSVSTGGQYA